MAGSFFDRLIGSLRGAGGGTVGGANMPAPNLPGYFASLAKEQAGLPGAVVRYIVQGDNSSVILTLQQCTTRFGWRNRRRNWPDKDAEALLADPDRWQIDQIRRLGKVLAALAPLNSNVEWGHFGNRKSPDWLRHVLSLWLGSDRKNQSLALLADLAALDGDPVSPVLDVVFTREVLIDCACGSAKGVRTSARQALTACDKPSLDQAGGAKSLSPVAWPALRPAHLPRCMNFPPAPMAPKATPRSMAVGLMQAGRSSCPRPPRCRPKCWQSSNRRWARST